MDVASLVNFLHPFLPFLLRLDERFTSENTKSFDDESWNKAKEIWMVLYPELEVNEDLKIAAERVAAKLSSDVRKAGFEEELTIALKRDLHLAEAIAQILQVNAPDPKTSHQNSQRVEKPSDGTVIQGSVFNIEGSSITNLTASGNIYYQEASHHQSNRDETAGDVGRTEPVKTILVLAANPVGTTLLRLGEEVRSLRRGLERSWYRDRFDLKERWAVTATDIRQALLDYQPQFVHFSGHGVGLETTNHEPLSARKLSMVSSSSMELEGLVLEDEIGQPKLVSGAAIASLFALFKDQIECVVLNACYSEVQARAIAQHIPYVVGMKRAIGDRAAIEFAIGFYDAILAGRDVEFAYKLGCSAIQMAGISEQLTPKLFPEKH